MSITIHPTAVVDPAAKLGAGTVVGPYAVIGPKTILGEGCFVGPHCVLDQVRAGAGNRFEASVYAGTPPQDLRHKGEEFFVVMGERNVFRECVTLNRGTKGDTVVGSDCFLMAYSHVAHDCKVGSNVIMANSATLAGHVELGDGAVLSGLAAVHQYVRIGTLAMLSGLSGAVQDLPPYCTASGGRAGLVGLNLVGMRRAGIPRENISKVREAYKALFLRGLRLEEALAQLKDSPIPEVRTLASFVAQSKRGVMRPRAAKGEAVEEVEA